MFQDQTLGCLPQHSGPNAALAPTELEIPPREISALPQTTGSSNEGHYSRISSPSDRPWLPLRNIINAPAENSAEYILNTLRLASSQEFHHYSRGIPADLALLTKGIVNYFTQSSVPITSSVEFVKTLLATSNMPYWHLSSRQCILDFAKQFLQLQGEITYRRSILMRLKGDVKVSKDTIATFLSSLNIGPDGWARCEDLTALYLSQATNHLYHFNFVEAHEEVRKITNLPGRQEHLLWDQVLCIGRIMRGEGRFDEAKTCFEICLRTPGLRDSKRFLVQSALADLYCELDYQAGNQSSYLSQAKEIVEPEIERLRLSSGRHLKGYRRLLLSIVEVKIRQGYYQDADILTRELIAIYGKLREPDIVDQLGHVRARIALARLSPTPEDALERWKDVLGWNRFYNPLEEEVFTCSVVYLFLCITWYKLGDIDKSMDSFHDAMRVMESKQCQFLIPGIGTYLFRDVCDQIKSTIWWLVTSNVFPENVITE
ncbi:hypothetical protein PRK78_004877 [Emydomyces testavorans]|uniref:Uncharacterized protein n=1 Tax=Emydomyces testavorans TaxID=2070801 RepID=A0AAF0DMB5_9EURO|nr:hypothetical protein PRK78_004877 [Emydomyces testavorans]